MSETQTRGVAFITAPRYGFLLCCIIIQSKTAKRNDKEKKGSTHQKV